MKNLPTLYKKGAAGELLQWSIRVEGTTIVTVWGRIGGAMQTTRDTIKEGKNLGKNNATSPEEQAQAEALSKWEKQLKAKGYVQSLADAEVGKRDARVLGGIDVMLAHRYDQHGHKIVWPAFAQPKLDGHRCIAMVESGKASLWTRTRKPITGVPHIIADLETLIEGNAIFDGELYCHEYRENFEELTSFIRQEEPKEGHEVVQYHIYDLPWINGDFQDRFETLKEFFDSVTPEFRIKLVETIQVQDEDDLMTAFERFLKQGFEGAMVRNTKGPYVGKRSYDLLKVKEFVDNEFLCVGVNEGKGKLAGHAIFVCETEHGNQFTVKMIGELEELKKYVKSPKLAIGRMLTVKYQGLTKANGVPRFPVAVRFLADI
jgi:DNA ligase-1